MIHRRAFGVTLALATAAGPRASAAQSPAKVVRLGVLVFGARPADANLPRLLDALRDLGYAEGRNLAIEYRYAAGRPERLSELAADLVRLKPDLIYAAGGDVARHVRDATRSTPIVAVTSDDPVESGLVASFARHPIAMVIVAAALFVTLVGAAAAAAAEISCPAGALPASPTVKELIVDLREVRQRQAGFDKGQYPWRGDPRFMAYVELGSPLDRDVEFEEMRLERESETEAVVFGQGSRCWYRVTLRRFTGPRGVWTPVRIEYGRAEGAR